MSNFYDEVCEYSYSTPVTENFSMSNFFDEVCEYSSFTPVTENFNISTVTNLDLTNYKKVDKLPPGLKDTFCTGLANDFKKDCNKGCLSSDPECAPNCNLSADKKKLSCLGSGEKPDDFLINKLLKQDYKV
jgi:hypothetical protein